MARVFGIIIRGGVALIVEELTVHLTGIHGLALEIIAAIGIGLASGMTPKCRNLPSCYSHVPSLPAKAT